VLTAEQLLKIENIKEDARRYKLKVLPRGSRTCATNEYRPKIVQALEGLRGTLTPLANLKELALTDQQISQIKAIRAEYRPRVQEAGNRLRAIVREEIAAVVTVLKA
jgi:hypothetical protein